MTTIPSTTATTATSPAATFASRYAAAFGAASPERLADCFRPDAVLVHPIFGRVAGREAILASESAMFGAFDQISVDIRRVIAGDDWSALTYVTRARQVADIPLPPGDVIANRGTRIAIAGCEIIRLDGDGLAFETHRYFDTAAMMAALASGRDLAEPVLPAVASAPDPGGAAPSAMANAELVKAAYEAGDLGAVAGRYADDAVLIHPIAGTLNGRTNIAAAEGGLLNCFTDIDFDIERVIQHGWWAAVELTVAATHCAPLPLPDGTSIAASGRRVTDHLTQVLRLTADGRMAYAERYLDAGALLRQLTT